MSGAQVREARQARPVKRVALYGGSFDPPHQCHVLVATWALCRGGAGGSTLDEVRLVPALGHAFGKSLTPFDVRCAMLTEAVRHLGPRVVVDPIEGSLPVPSYTIDTVKAMMAKEPSTAIEVTLVMGADAWAERQRWKAWHELETLIGGRVLVVGRGAEAGPEGAFALPDVSSTEIRRRVRAGEPYWWMVPEGVRAIIEREGLYRA